MKKSCHFSSYYGVAYCIPSINVPFDEMLRARRIKAGTARSHVKYGENVFDRKIGFPPFLRIRR
jgi:hypothetical protein